MCSWAETKGKEGEPWNLSSLCEVSILPWRPSLPSSRASSIFLWLARAPRARGKQASGTLLVFPPHRILGTFCGASEQIQSWLVTVSIALLGPWRGSWAAAFPELVATSPLALSL